MSTRSMIGVVREDGKIDCIYCHFDGYLEYVGKVLNECYQDKDKIRGLINLGDISSLGRYIYRPEGHSYDHPVKECTVAYGRDRGEEDVGFKTVDDKDAFIKRASDMWCKFYYLYDNNKWIVFLDNKWIDLKEALNNN